MKQDFVDGVMVKWDEKTFDEHGKPGWEGFTIKRDHPSEISPRQDEQGLCPWPPSRLKQMLESHEERVATCGGKACCTCCSYPACVLYNEIVIQSAAWDAAMPEAVEAIAVPTHANEDAWRAARQIHKHLTGRCLPRGTRDEGYHKGRGSSIPLLSVNVDREGRPDEPFQTLDEDELDEKYGPVAC